MQSNVERVKEKMDIVSVVGGYVTLVKAGALLRARCPFHNEKSPSFTVSPVRQTYHCFGCGEHGDIFTFVEKIEGMDFREALDLLAQKAGITLEKETRKGSVSGNGEGYDTGYVSKDEKEALFAVNEAASKVYEENLKDEKEILEYLKNRGLSDKTVSTFRLGFAKDSWQATFDALHMIAKTSTESAELFTDSDIEKSGLVGKSDKSGAEGRYYDRFRSRIMFPIPNAQGRVVGFTGRVWTAAGKTPDDTAAKYVNTPETMLYHKSSVLYGFHIAKHHIRPLNCVLIVEGQMDLLTCHQVGYTNAVAISGTALTEEQVRQLSRLTKNFLLALDSDKAGVDATLKSIDKALAFGCDIKVVSFRGKDASEVLQKEGAEAVKECIRQAEDWCSYLLSVIEKRSEGDTRIRARLVNELLIPLVKIVDNPLERDALLATIHERTQLSLDSLRESLAKPSAKLTQNVPGPSSYSGSKDSGQISAKIASTTASSIDLLFACMDIAEMREHEKYAEWQLRLATIPKPALTTEQAHKLLLSFPEIQNATHVAEIVEELFGRAEKEHYKNELIVVGEALRSAELAGDDVLAADLAQKAGELHKKLHTLQ
jgi:DNA primase